MRPEKTDIVLLGPAPPYRGGIAETQMYFGQTLSKKRAINCGLLTIYIPIFFSRAIAAGSKPNDHLISFSKNPRIILQWREVVRTFKHEPSVVVFRLWTLSHSLLECPSKILALWD